MPWEEHFMFFSMVLSGPDYPVVEIGSLFGQSSLAFAEACKIKNTQFISIDPYPDDPTTQELFRKFILQNYPETKQINNDLSECIEQVPDKLALVYIDGCHDFEHPDREWKLLFPRIVPSGWLVIDDIDTDPGPGKVADYALNNSDVLYYNDIQLKNPTEKIMRVIRKR